jgi:Kef-type K+ transport system membrane component KefB
MYSLISIPVDTNPQAYKILLPLGLLLLFSKVFSLLLGKLKVPQVIGYLVAGLVVGLIYLIPNQQILTDYTHDGISFFAKIGVILIMFSAGIETDIKKMKTVGPAAFAVATLGVLVPMILCFLMAYVFDIVVGNEVNIFKELFYGVILTATSVSVTVATLKELGKLDTKVGSCLVSAAIIDDVLGIIVLSLVISLSGSNSTGSDFASLTLNALNQTSNTFLNILFIILYMAVYFGLTFVAGYFVRKLFNWLGSKYPHHIRIVIISLALCLLWSYISEFFNIADITGAYLMGLILSSTVAHGYIDHRAETTCNYLFGPIFFGSIAMGLYQSEFDFSDPKFVQFLIFGVFWIIIGIFGKIIGCTCAGLMFKFKFHDSIKFGFGMMARAEVLIVCAEKGVNCGLVDNRIMMFCLVLILLSSFITPIFLKLSYRKEIAEERNLEKPANNEVTELANNIANAEIGSGDTK